MTEKLKSCPFCGDNNLFFHFETYRDNPERPYAMPYESALDNFYDIPESFKDYPVDISCMNCGTYKHIQKDIPEAINEWNRRANDEPEN